MARVYKPVGPSSNKVTDPGQEKKDSSKSPVPLKGDEKKDEGGEK